jgi:hypothetical protein
MTWDYAYALNALDLADVATFATIEDEVPSPYSDIGVQVPGRDGITFDDEAPFSPLVATLRVHLRWTDETGAVNHADGEAGHIYENLSLLKREINKAAPTLTRTVPHIGDVRAVVKSNTPGFVGRQRQVYVFPLTVPSGSWQTVTESSAVGNPPAVVTSGDRVIFDPIIIFSAASTVTVTNPDGSEYQITAAAGPTYPVTVDVGAGTVLASGGADARGDVSFTELAWCRLQQASTITVVTTASTTIKWRNRWA